MGKKKAKRRKLSQNLHGLEPEEVFFTLIGVGLGLMLFKKLRGKALEARRKKNVSELIQLKKPHSTTYFKNEMFAPSMQELSIKNCTPNEQTIAITF